MAKGEIASLPVWAQRLIAEKEEAARLARRDLEYFVARNCAGMDHSTVVADPYSSAPRPMGRDTPVRFTDGEVSFLAQFDSEDGTLTITATGSRASSDLLAVYPSTGNCVRLRGGRA